jgi:LysR family transcriptional regulator, nitrogen assimilation regulatory protein
VRPISSPSLRSKLSIAMSSQRPATLTQKAVLQLIQPMARKLLVAP